MTAQAAPPKALARRVAIYARVSTQELNARFTAVVRAQLEPRPYSVVEGGYAAEKSSNSSPTQFLECNALGRPEESDE
jgi:hypothetical protein